MKHLKKFNEEFDWLKKKSNPNPVEEKNIEILQSIYDLGLEIHEGPFKPSSWERRGDLIPSENRNDEVITNFAGISLAYDLETQEYKLALPVKFKGEFKDKIYQLLDSKFTILHKKDTGYTTVISFK